jgi:hypothetical protein
VQLQLQTTRGRYQLAEDPRLEAGARARCAFHGLNPDEPALVKGNLAPLWKTFVPEVLAVVDAADAADRATPAMEQAGITALHSGAADPGGLFTKSGRRCPLSEEHKTQINRWRETDRQIEQPETAINHSGSGCATWHTGTACGHLSP